MNAEKQSKKVMIVATNGQSLYNFRGAFVKDLVAEGHETVCVSIESPEEIGDRVEKLGARYIQVDGNRTGIGIFDGFKMIKKYRKLFDEEKPDVCFLYMSKPIAFGGIAAIKSKVPSINVLVNGLENAYYRTGIKDFVVRTVMSYFYKKVAKKASNVFFQNHDDMKYFTDHKMLTRDNACVVGGSGVDMQHFAKSKLPDEPVILMTARLLWSKGIREFLEAVSKAKAKCPELRVMLVGGLDNNDEALTKVELDSYVAINDIEYCGFAEDVRPYLNKCSIFVLPSYHEGLPRSVLEAMSVGRPIITTDVPGCRETVTDGDNGYLVPVRDSEVLADRMVKLAQDKGLREKMAERSYEICCERFEVSGVNRMMMEKMNLVR